MTRLSRTRLATFAALTLAVSACQPASQDGAAGDAPPMPVSTVTTTAIEAPLTADLPGRLASTRVAEVRAQVGGIVKERAFTEGSTVKAGDVLFRIDPAVYRAEVDARVAALARAEATRVQARKAAERVDTLNERQIASSAQNEIAIATLRQAEADVAAAKAGLDRARINLDYATVKAPISGRIGRALVTEGALVGQNDPTHLATIQQIDPIYADFVQPALDPWLAERTAGTTPTDVRLVDTGGNAYGEPGKLLFSDVTVDPGTGQVSLRATFPNARGTLLPGTYVRVRVPRGMKKDAVLVPAQAIQRSSAGEAQAYVVEGGKLALRPLKTGSLTDAGWIVEEGLKPGETVVVEGFQKVQPGMAVAPQPWKPGPAAPATEQVKP